MAVKIGSARSSFGNEKPGDQHSGLEVSTQNWYLHSKGWVVLRAKDANIRKYIAEAMRAACKNNNIGYSQTTRMGLYNNVKTKGFDPSKTTTAVNCDCSSLVRVCILYALTKTGLGASFDPGNFRTATETNMLVKTGLFEKITDDKHCKKSAYLAEGDILNTKTSGHTVVVLSSGPDCDAANTSVITYNLGDRALKNGCSGDDVKELQTILISIGYDCGIWGSDGDFGDATEIAVTKFQKDNDMSIDGIVTVSLLEKLYIAAGMEDKISGTYVYIVNGKCYIRDAANTESNKIGIAKTGETYAYAGETTLEGWHKVKLSNGNTGWISGKYSRLS